MAPCTAATQILWAGTIGFDRPVTEYVDAACGAGTPEISVNLDHLAGEEPTGPAVRSLTAYAADHGVTVAVVDGLYSWLPLGPTRLAARTRPLDEALALAEALGAASLNALVPDLGLGEEALAEHFAAACDQALEVGCAIHLEFSPIGGLATLSKARQVARLAGRPNGGVLLDTWHFFRGDADFDTLARMGAGEIFAVQVSDASSEVHGSLWDDTLHHRRLPGDGAFDLERVVRILAAAGPLPRLGPEIISDELGAMQGPEAARLAAQSVADLVVRALGDG